MCVNSRIARHLYKSRNVQILASVSTQLHIFRLLRKGKQFKSPNCRALRLRVQKCNKPSTLTTFCPNENVSTVDWLR
jgi:hypothetical protein